MSGKSDRRQAAIFRRKVREMLMAGASIAQIVKATGKSHRHVTQIVEQERDECIRLIAEGATP